MSYTGNAASNLDGLALCVYAHKFLGLYHTFSLATRVIYPAG